MKRSLFEKIHSNFLTEKSLKAQKKQKNYVSRLYKNEVKIFLIASIHQLFQIIESFTEISILQKMLKI